MNTHSSLIAELKDKEYRDAYVASQITIGLPFQVRALRADREWTQEELAERAGMSQPRVAEIEKPNKRRFNLETLLRIASAFDVGLEVRFVPISQIVDDSEGLDPDAFTVKPFTEELAEAERAEASAQVAMASQSALLAIQQQLEHWARQPRQAFETIRLAFSNPQDVAAHQISGPWLQLVRRSSPKELSGSPNAEALVEPALNQIQCVEPTLPELYGRTEAVSDGNARYERAAGA